MLRARLYNGKEAPYHTVSGMFAEPKVTDNTLLLLVVTAFLAALNMAVTLVLWRALRRMRETMGNVRATTLRIEREMGQHRYAIAMLRQMQKDMPDDGTRKTDEEMLDAAVTHLDALAGAGDEAKATMPNANVSLDTLNDNDILQFIKKAVKSNHIAVSQQPIVNLPHRQTRYYEVFSRILVGDDGYIPASKFVSVAKSNNLIGAVDNLLLLRCLQILKNSPHKEQNSEFFINISAQTLSNKNYIQDLIEFLASNPKLSARLIFEMTQQDSLTLNATTRGVMEGLALLGCRFSMDQVTSFGVDVSRLVDQNISFIKLDARVLEKEMADASNRKRLKKIKSVLDMQGINVIVEKVENEKQLFNLLDLHMDYGQGFLFGQPVPMG